MATRVYINGTIRDPEDAKISVFDRGFLYGDSVYEVLRSSGGHLVDLERHLKRLRASAQGLALSIPSEEIVRDAITSTLAAAGNEESYVRIMVTRGAGEVGLDPEHADSPTLLVFVKPLVLPSAEMYEQGVSVRVVHVQRTSARAIDPSLKSGNYLNNILALAEARKSGDYEAIMCDREGWLAEGSSSNLFFVHHGVLYTPSLSVGLLAGITRQRVLELAKQSGLPIQEGRLEPEALRRADEAFLTSSIRGVLPIVRVDGQALVDAVPGSITARITTAYAAFLAQEAQG